MGVPHQGFGSLNSHQMHMWEQGANPSNDVMDKFTNATDYIRAANTTQGQRGRHAEATNQIHLSSCKTRLVQMIQMRGRRSPSPFPQHGGGVVGGHAPAFTLGITPAFTHLAPQTPSALFAMYPACLLGGPEPAPFN